MSALRKQWSCESIADSENAVGSWKCCKKLKCFKDCDEKYFTLQRRIILHATRQHRRHLLSSFLASNRSLFFNGKQICDKFMSTAFHFSNNMQASIRKAMKKRLSDNDISYVRSDGAAGGAMVPDAPCKEVVLSFLARFGESVSDHMPIKWNYTYRFTRSGTYMIFLFKSRPCFETAPLSFCLVLSRYGTNHAVT